VLSSEPWPLATLVECLRSGFLSLRGYSHGRRHGIPLLASRLGRQLRQWLRVPALGLACPPSASGRVRMYASVSCSACQCERQVSGKALGSLRTRSRPVAAGQAIQLPAALPTLQKSPPNLSELAVARGALRIRAREARGWPRAGRGWRRCARAWDSAGRRDLRWSRCDSARHPSRGATPLARCSWPP
jgi:hypothetical protein